MSSTAVCPIHVFLPSAEQSNCRGVAILELAFVLPILILLLFSGFEFSRVLRSHQTIASIAREVAREAYRECSPDAASFQDACVTTEQCLEDILEKTSSLVDSSRQLGTPFIQDIKIILSVYRSNVMAGPSGPVGGCVLEGEADRIAPADGREHPGWDSRYSAAKVEANAGLQQVVTDNGFLLITELYAKQADFYIPILFGDESLLSEYYYVVLH